MSTGHKSWEVIDSNQPKKHDLNEVERILRSPNASSDRHGHADLIHLNEKTLNGPNTNSRKYSDDVEAVPTQPLLHDKANPKPPLAVPETNDTESETPASAIPYPGIDDGLLDVDEKNPHGYGNELKPENGQPGAGEDAATDVPWTGDDEPDYPYDPNIHKFGYDDRPISPMIPGSIPDVNTYQQKKNLAQGMMDLALLSANANQLRYVLESKSTHPYYYPSVVFISLSIGLQVAVGVGLIMNSRYNVKDESDICKADKINNMTVLGIFLITIVNVFIASFSVATNVDLSGTGLQTVRPSN